VEEEKNGNELLRCSSDHDSHVSIESFVNLGEASNDFCCATVSHMLVGKISSVNSDNGAEQLVI